MICCRADFAFATRAYDVAGAILVGTKERAATVHFFLFRRLRGTKWRGRALGISGHAPCGDQPCVIVHAIPIAGPLPDVAGHVIEAVAVRRILRDWGDADVAVVTFVCP